jgi:hypothetical protein
VQHNPQPRRESSQVQRHAKASTAGLAYSPRSCCSTLAVVSLAALLLFVSAASAATGTDRPLLFSFDGRYLYGADGQPLEETETTAGAFRDERNLEVEQESGDLYVADEGEGEKVLDKFSAEGQPLDFEALGKSSLLVSANTSGASNKFDVALGNPPNPPIYVTSAFQAGPLLAFDNGGSPLGWQLSSPADFAIGCGAGVDPEGRLWVMDRGSSPQRALEFDTSASPPVKIGEFPYTHGGSFPCSIDFDAAGNAYVASQGNGGGAFKYIKNGAGGFEYSVTLDPEEGTGVAVEREDGHVFVSHDSYFNEYDASGTLLGSFGKGVLSSGQGIAVNESGAGGVAPGTVYVANFSGHKVYAFGPVASGTVPDVEAGPPSELEVSRARLNGKVSPNGVPNAYLFEWKPGIYPDNWGKAKSSPPASLPEDNGEYPVSLDVGELAGNSTYQARLVGLNTENGLREVSEAVTFTTKTASGPPGVTIDPVQAEATPPCTTGITTEGACVSGAVNPREDFGTTWWVETSEAPPGEPDKCSAGFAKGPVHNLESEANAPVPIEETLSGLKPSELYCVRLAARNSAGTATKPKEGEPAVEFTTEPLAPDQVASAFAAPRTQTMARLNAYANPEGEAMAYRFEYSADGGANWTSLPSHEDESEARRPLLFSEELSGLEPGHPYSFRFLAENHCHPIAEPEAWCSVEGGEKTFATRSLAEAQEVEPPSCPNEEVRRQRGFDYLPQCRGMELVNNPEDGNQNVKAIVDQGTAPMSPDGEKVVWNVIGGAPGGNSGFGATFLARRSGPSEAAPTGWASQSLIPPAAEQVEAERGSYALGAATPDLSSFLFVAGSGGNEGGGRTMVRIGEDGSQEVLWQYPRAGQSAANADLSADGSHVVRFDNTGSEGEAQLEDIGRAGEPEAVSYLPDGSEPECIEPEGSSFIGGEPAYGGAGNHWRPGYHLSATTDGSRVYFQVNPNGECGPYEPWWLLERDREANGGKGETLEVAPPDPWNALIRATPDGRSAYFVTKLSLDKEGGDTDGGLDVYRWDEESEADTCLTCAMENEAGETVEGAKLRVLVGPAPVMVSDDFSHLYFESEAKLAPQATPGESNLYALDLAEEKLHFVATMNGGSYGALSQGGGSGKGELSRNGEVLVFETPEGNTNRLTADSLAASCSLPVGGSGPCTELYRYDDRDGSLGCISCLGGGITSASAGANGYNDFRISGDGETVAFVTAQKLLPSDINRGPDLYEWRAGEQRLLTDGEGSFSQGGSGALQPYALSEDGRDVLFAVVDPGLTGFEANRLANLYDARIGGGFEVPPAPIHCWDGSEEACQGTLEPPPPRSSYNTATHTGSGNVEEPRPRRCRHGKVRRRGRCVKRHRHRRRAAHPHRRAGR